MNKRKSGFRQYESDHASVTTYFHQWWQEKEKLELKHFKERKIPGLRKILFEKNLERQIECEPKTVKCRKDNRTTVAVHQCNHPDRG